MEDLGVSEPIEAYFDETKPLKQEEAVQFTWTASIDSWRFSNVKLGL
jgi:hypothetical protein